MAIPTNNVSLVIESVFLTETGKKSIKPDANGWYKGIPCAVLDYVSRNRTRYDSQSFIEQLEDPESRFRMLIEEGSLIGEYGHPPIEHLSLKAAIQRTKTLEPTRESHTIGKCYIKEIEGKKIVFIDIKPSGPFGSYLKEKLEDPTVNVAFSLRALTKDVYNAKEGVIDRKFVSLITFDSVPGGGFKEASKSYALSTESLNISLPITLEPEEIVAMENLFTDWEIKRMFSKTKLVIKEKTIGAIYDGKYVLDEESKQVYSPFHVFVNWR